MKLLLSRGANINAFDKKDRRAIHWGAYMGQFSLGQIIKMTVFDQTTKRQLFHLSLILSSSSHLYRSRIFPSQDLNVRNLDDLRQQKVF